VRRCYASKPPLPRERSANNNSVTTPPPPAPSQFADFCNKIGT